MNSLKKWGGVFIEGNGFILWIHKDNDAKEMQLNDYKFYCFDGRVKMVMINTDRNGREHTKADYFDREFNYMDFTWGYPHAKEKPPKPKSYDEMILLAEMLSKGLKHVRVDLYNVDGKIYFGEITFYDGSGFDLIEPFEKDIELGNWIKLDIEMKEEQK